MKLVICTIIAVVYLIGLLTIQWLDRILPENLRESRYHYPVLIIMWLGSPLIVIGFIIREIIKFVTK